MLPTLGPTELIIVLVIVLLIVGPTKLPRLMGGLGKGIDEFKKGVKGEDGDSEKAVDQEMPKGSHRIPEENK